MATSSAAKLLKLSGPRGPYPGTLGVVKEDAHADWFRWTAITLVVDPDRSQGGLLDVSQRVMEDLQTPLEATPD